jgi:hypothetical protein
VLVRVSGILPDVLGDVVETFSCRVEGLHRSCFPASTIYSSPLQSDGCVPSLSTW